MHRHGRGDHPRERLEGTCHPKRSRGRLKPTGVLSKDGNSLVGDKIDLPLIGAFQSLMSLLNGSRDRGSNQPVRMTDAGGSTSVVKFGEPLKLAKPTYREETVGDATAVHIDARDLKELRTLLGRVKAKHPEFDIDEAVARAVTVRAWPDGMLRGNLQIGAGVVFPALFVSASIFAAHHGHAPHPKLRAYVAGFDPDQPALPPDTFHFIPSEPWISAPGEVTHIVALEASAERREMLVYLELFNVVSVGVLLPYAGSEDARATYAVDVLTGREQQVTVDGKVLAGTPWRATHQFGATALLGLTKERIARLIQIAKARATEAAAEALMTRAFGDDRDRPLTPEDLARGIAELADETLLEWRRPGTTPDMMEGDLQGFDDLVADFERFVPAADLPSFRTSSGKLRGRLEVALADRR